MTDGGSGAPRGFVYPRDPLEFERLSECEMLARARAFLETALQRRSVREFSSEPGRKVHHYYGGESVGIASGMLLAALNAAGLATLTHTPSPMGFLREILERPVNEKPYLLIPVGYSANGTTVPRLRKKELGDVMIVR